MPQRPDLSFTWTLRYVGWAFCTIADDHSQARVVASDITFGPEYLLRAVASLADSTDARADFEGEGRVCRWLFLRDGADVDIRLVSVPDSESSDSEGAVIWAGRHSVRALADAIVGGFDRALSALGDDAYREQWGRAFPNADVEALRAAHLTGEL